MDHPSKKQRGKFVVILGPSGVGKSVVMRALKEKHPALHFPKSATTRARRQGEAADLYHFLSEEEFDSSIAQGKFLEYQTVHGIARYGTLLEEILPFVDAGKIVLREIEVQGFDAIRMDKRFAGPASPYPLQSIFILPESKEQLIAHITRRSPISEEELQHRLQSMEKEMTYASLCDARVMSREGKIAETIAEIERLIGLKH